MKRSLSGQMSPRVILILGVLLTAFHSSAQVTATPPRTERPIDHLPALSGDYFQFESGSIGRPFHIFVRLPEGYDDGSSDRFPIVYLLDGDSLFPILASNHLFLTYDDGLPEAIIVGIAYGSFDAETNRRRFDFSAPAPDADPGQGGAPAFHAFLKSELIPEVEARYRADASFCLAKAGGGYMVLYSAFTDPDLFWGRIASNPSFAPGRDRFFAPAATATRNDLGLVVTSGSLDLPEARESALAWFREWQGRSDAPWALNVVTIEGGTHAADRTATALRCHGWEKPTMKLPQSLLTYALCVAAAILLLASAAASSAC